MSKVGFIVFLNNNAIGIYDNEEILNNFINGCYQNMFFSKDDIKIKKYSMNSISCLDSLESIKKIQNNKLEHDKEQEHDNQLENDKEQEQEHNNQLENERKQEYNKNKKELEESGEFKNLMQQKIDTKHQINQLKKEKKKLEEDQQLYEYDIKMYEKLKIENNKIENFEIPDIFALKFNIFEKMEINNQLNYDAFKIEWDKVKPSNNYSLFATNPYEVSFTNLANKEDIEIEIDIDI
jgi:hypothetical protein